MKLALLPGLVGTSAETYGPEFDALADEVLRVEWPPIDGSASIVQLAEQLLERDDLRDCEVVAGSSVGGMVAAEIAERAQVRRLVLIGSARRPGEVNEILGSLARMPGEVLVEHLKTLVGLDFYAGRERILEVLGRSEPGRVRALCAAIFGWEGRPQAACPSQRVHGAWDLVIPPPRDGAQIVAQAGHMVSLTHGAAVADALRSVIDELD